MRELVKLFTQIALLRRGPQDLPASMLLLVLTVIGYCFLSLLLNYLLPVPVADAAGHVTEVEPGTWAALVLLDTVFTLVWYAVLLRLAGRAERTLQTVTAVFGFQIVLAPFLSLSTWLLPRFAHDSTWGVPAAVTLLYIVTLVWLVAANSHIVKAALEWSVGASVALVILEILAAELLRRGLFPLAPA